MSKFSVSVILSMFKFINYMQKLLGDLEFLRRVVFIWILLSLSNFCYTQLVYEDALFIANNLYSEIPDGAKVAIIEPELILTNTSYIPENYDAKMRSLSETLISIKESL